MVSVIANLHRVQIAGTSQKTTDCKHDPNIMRLTALCAMNSSPNELSKYVSVRMRPVLKEADLVI